MTGTHCPMCHALTGASGITYHAPLCPNGVAHVLSWGTTDPDDTRLDSGHAPVRATSHVAGLPPVGGAE